MKIYMFIIFLLSNLFSFAQNKLDNPWNKNISDREYIPYNKVREADVFWSKRIWRIIDTREKQNLLFCYPQLPLFKILHTAALNNELKVYDNTVINGDKFKRILNEDDLNMIGVVDDTIMLMDLVTQLEIPTYIHEDIDFSKVKRFKIKEEWFFNSATSTMEVRIIGIAPLLEVYDDDYNYLGDETLYWIYYQDLRPILAKHEAYNYANNAVRLSWDDIFEARYFASYIYKEDNVYDRSIQEYATREEALYESERIKTLIFNFEHDLWTY